MHFLYNIKACACPISVLSSRCDEGGELSTNHQISYLCAGAISPCLSTPHLLYYSLQSHLNRQMTL